MKPTFTDVHFTLEPELRVTYRSGMTVREEGLCGGIYAALGWNGAGYAAYSCPLPEPPLLKLGSFPEPQAFVVEVDGQSLCSHWDLAGHESRQEPRGLHAVVSLRHTLRPVEATVHTLLDGSPVLTRWIEVKNADVKPVALGMTAPLSGGLQSVKQWRGKVREGSSLYRLGYMEYTKHLNEGGFQWHDLPNAGYYFGGRRIRSRYRHPMFILEDRAMGSRFICQLAWSGGYRFSFDLDAETEDAHLSFMVALDAPSPLRVMAPGETVASPAVHIGMLFGDLDDCVNAMHDHVRKSVMLPQARGRGAWVESAMGPNIPLTLEVVKRRIDEAARIGAEIFLIDASWYFPADQTTRWWAYVGDWEPDPARWPVSIEDARDYARAKGLLFGLWMEPERFGVDSGAFKEHAAWCTTGYDGAVKGAVGGGGGMVDLAKPEAAAWVERQMAGLIERFSLDFFRLDFNVDTVTPSCCNERDGYLENCDWRYYEAFYCIMERLRARFPDVVFEACASGGGRTDLGCVRYFCHTWVTDCQLAPRSFAITNGMTMCLPPECVDRLLTGQNGFTTGSLDFQARLLLFARPTVTVNTPMGFPPNEAQVERIRRFVELYKGFARPMLPGAKIFHHTPEVGGPEPRGTGVLELAAADGERALMGIFQLSDPETAELTVRFKGIDESRRYRVTRENSGASFTVGGWTLMMKGLTVPLGGSFTSELLLAQAE